MKSILTFSLALFTIGSFAQSTIKNFTDCEVEMFFVSADTKPQFDHSGQDIFGYLSPIFKEKAVLNKANGKILLGILVYENGKP